MYEPKAAFLRTTAPMQLINIPVSKKAPMENGFPSMSLVDLQ